MAFPGTYNFSYYRGDTFEFSIYPKNTDGSAFDLTDYTAYFSVATSRGATPVSSSVAITSDRIDCVILPTESELWEESNQYVYDVEIVNTSGTYDKIYTVLTGTISVTEQITITEV